MSEKKVLTFSCVFFSPQLMKTLILKGPRWGSGGPMFSRGGGSNCLFLWKSIKLLIFQVCVCGGVLICA